MSDVKSLIANTIQQPANAAQKILQKSASSEAIWTGFALVQVLNTLVFLVQKMIMPPPIPLLAAVGPVEYLVISAVLQLLLVSTVTQVGRWLNGQGGFYTVLTCMLWVNFIHVMAVAVMTALMLVSPVFFGLLAMAENVFALYVLLHFVNVVHQLNSLWRAFGVLVLAFLGVILIVSFFGRILLQSLMG